MSFEKWMKLDLEYVKQKSATVDLKIFLSTISMLLKNLSAWHRQPRTKSKDLINFRGLRVLGILLQVYMSEQIPLSSQVCIRFRIHPRQKLRFRRGVLRANIKVLQAGRSVDLIHRSKVVGEIKPKIYEPKPFDPDKFIKAVKKLNFPSLTPKQIEARYRAAMIKKHGKGLP